MIFLLLRVRIVKVLTKAGAKMNNEYGRNFISLTDGEGKTFELEYLDTIEYKGFPYLAFVPAGEDAENDPDYGLIILKALKENGEEVLITVDDDNELEAVYEVFMCELFDEDDGQE